MHNFHSNYKKIDNEVFYTGITITFIFFNCSMNIINNIKLEKSVLGYIVEFSY